MKNIFILAAAAAFVLSSCSNEEIVKAPEAQEDGAVVFGAYAGRNTRAEAIGNVKGLVENDGFGVFAYEQGTTPWATYRASNTYPNFMYNQHVEGTMLDLVSAEWTYAPVKYFSNNLNAKHSFFAYAPYKANPSVVFSKTNQGPAIRYNASTDDYDLMWGARDDRAWYDLGKLGVTDKITFNFKHALAKVDFDVTYFVDDVHSDAHNEGTNLAPGTEILVRSVKFIGNVPSQGILDLYDGKWTIETTEESAYEIVPTDPIKFKSNDNANAYKDIKKDMMVIPTLSGNVRIQVVYDVITTDSKNPKNNSIVTNVIESPEEGYALNAGTAYKFHLDLGLTTVKFTAETATWGTSTENNVDLPNNYSYSELSVTPLTTDQVGDTSNRPTSPADGTTYLDTESKKYLKYDGTISDFITDTSVNGNFYDGQGHKLYVVTAGDITEEETVNINITTLEALKTAATGYYEVGGKVYKVK